MAITTLSRREALRDTQDPEICAELAVLPRPPVVEEYQVLTHRHWWQRPQTQTLYSVLWPLGNTPLGLEWQVVNFYRDTSGTTINTAVPKELVLAYLYGYVTAQRRAPLPCPDAGDVIHAPGSPRNHDDPQAISLDPPTHKKQA